MTEGPRDDGRADAPDPSDAPGTSGGTDAHAGAAPDAETTWLSPGAAAGPASPTADTVALGGSPTTADPLLPPPAWAAPSAPAAPAASAPPGAVAPGWGAAAYPPPAVPPPPPPAGWTSTGSPVPPPPVPPPPVPPSPVPPPAAPATGAPVGAVPPAPAYGPPGYGPPGSGPATAGPAAYAPGVSGWGAVPRAPKPGIVALRPLGVGDILDGAISYIRRDPATVLGLATVLSLVLSVSQLWALTATGDALSISTGEASLDETLSSAFGSTAATLVQSVLSLVVGVVATGLLTVVIGQAVLGRRVSIQEAWARGSRRLLPLLGLTLLVTLLTGLVAVVGIALGVGLGTLVGQAVDVGLGVLVGLPFGVAGVAVAVWVYIRLLLAPVGLVLENTGVVRSLQRSWDLVGGAWWRTFGIYLLATILVSVVASVLAVPFSLVGAALSFDDLAAGTFPLSYTIPLTLGTLITGVVTIPFSAGVVALLYVDRRIRREALDLELARAAGV